MLLHLIQIMWQIHVHTATFIYIHLYLGDDGLGAGCGKRSEHEGVGFKKETGKKTGLEMWGTKEGSGLKERSHGVRVGWKELKGGESWRRQDLKEGSTGVRGRTGFGAAFSLTYI